MFENNKNTPPPNKGFTLIELMVVVIILGIIMAAIVQVLISTQNAKRDVELIAQAQQESRIVLDMVSDDIRSAGYGIDEIGGQLAIARAAPFDLIMNANLFPYPDDLKNPGAPQSMKNSSTPKPGINGTLLYDANYTNSAETIRYAFDSNNDGAVTTGDRGDDIEERIMRNDSLYSLVKQVFGYNPSTASNGGASNSVAIGRLNFPARSSGRPVEPLFKYWIHDHMWGDANSDGVLSDAELTALYASTGGGLAPQDSLKYINKVEITFTGQTASTSKGRYKIFTVSTTVNITRNRVLKDAKMINGLVYVDQNFDKVHQTGEPGVPYAIVSLNTGVVCSTNTSGEYHFSVYPGQYRINIKMPLVSCTSTNAYLAKCMTDTMVNARVSDVNVAHPCSTYTPGYLRGIAFLDDGAGGGIAGNGIKEPGEGGFAGINLQVLPDFSIYITDASGLYCFPLKPGTYKIYARSTDVEYIVSPDSVAGIVITAGGTVTKDFAVRKTGFCVIQGKVYYDANKSATYTSGERGINRVRILAMLGPVGSQVYAAEAYTDTGGNYNLKMPSNFGTSNQYSIEEIDSAGYTSTTSNTYSNIFFTKADGETLTGRDFGDIKFQAVAIPAARVMCLATTDFIEKKDTLSPLSQDWSNLSDFTTRKQDKDIMLGTRYDATVQTNVITWFNKYQSSATLLDKMFAQSPSYTRIVTSADIYSLAADSLDEIRYKSGGSWTVNYNHSRTRPDLVIGTSHNSVGISSNLDIWYTYNDDINDSCGRLMPAAAHLLAAGDPANCDVNVVLTGEVGANDAANNMPDVIAGYSNFVESSYSGGVSIWINQYSAPSGSGTRQVQSFNATPDLNITSSLGKVKTIALGSLVAGKLHLVVGSVIAANSSRINIYEITPGNPPTATYKTELSITSSEINKLALADISGDGKLDIIVGVTNGTYTGQLQYWKNNDALSFGVLSGVWLPTKYVDLPGEVTSLATGIIGVGSHPDILVGLRTAQYAGKCLLFITSLVGSEGVMGSAGGDISGGSSLGEVAAISIADFNKDTRNDIVVAHKTTSGSVENGQLRVYFPE